MAIASVHLASGAKERSFTWAIGGLARHHHRGGRTAPLPPLLRQRLERYYAEPRREFNVLLGHALGW